MKRYSAWGHDGSFKFKWQAKLWKWNACRVQRKNEHIELLRSIAKSLKEIENVIDINSQYGNAIKTVIAARY